MWLNLDERIDPFAAEEYQASALQSALDNAEEQFRTAVKMMGKKLTAHQHLKGLLSASLRQEQPLDDVSMVDEMDFDAEASASELELFDGLKEYDPESGEWCLYKWLLAGTANCWEILPMTMKANIIN